MQASKWPSSKPSASHELVPVGPRDVQLSRRARRDDNGHLPTTARALVLRNGKYGARGTGELVATRKISGREKLDLLGEDLMAKSKQAIATPFNLSKCYSIADSQYNVYLDDICDLRDVNFFYAHIVGEILAHSSQDNPASPNDRSVVVTAVGSSIHNSYMLASVWRIIRTYFEIFEEDGLTTKNVRNKLRQDEDMRTQYLILYDIVNVLVDTAQAKFSQLATHTKHFSQYFKTYEGDDLNDLKMMFDWGAVKESYKSFVDSIIIELCLPQSAFPKYVLTAILQEAVEEVPSESKRFPQALWDALGDFSVAVQLQEMLEGPLLGSEGDKWRKLPRTMPEEFEVWCDAQIMSERASKDLDEALDVIFPLQKAKNHAAVTDMWRRVNTTYEALTGQDLDELWQLEGEIYRTAHWTARQPTADLVAYDHPQGKKQNKKNGRLAITDGNDSDSMPSLESVSDSSEEGSDSDSYHDEVVDDDADDDDSVGYDTEEEDMMRDLLREAMDEISSYPGFFDPTQTLNEQLAEERKGNPFLKLLGSLRGRMFSSSPTLKTTDRKTPRTPYPGTKPVFTSTVQAGNAPSKVSTPPQSPRPPVPVNRNVTVEEVDDEDAEPSKRKKKHKKKKKKSIATAPTQPQSTAPISPVVLTPPAQTKPSVVKSPAASMSTAQSNASSATLTNVSSIELTRQQTAQSAHSYLQSEGLKEQKSKVKSRANHANLVPIPEKEKKGLFSRFVKTKGEKGDAAEMPKEKDEQSLQKWFSRLGKKTKDNMHQLLGSKGDVKKGSASMKWDTFLKVMQEMGFTYDPSTAGSSVRFDPPGGEKRSISFHKPHPDPTLHPVKLKIFGKKLKDYYGWDENYLMQQAGN